MAHFLKWIHLINTLGLVACLVGSCFTFRQPISATPYPRLLITEGRLIFTLLSLQLLTGSLLVIPSHFTFGTPWISAAYTLVLLIGTLYCYLTRQHTQQRLTRRVYTVSLWAIGIALLLIIHDAITKKTFFQ
ncbi:MAG: hypothetical protein A3J38_10245 [Gammaproteobacteria bacterium RIFCSPHIGHO2_12_FULL_45_9]|nr:MAG: hypothetical protein A3J38_10245 [Gammaproteobacteria bacterium RIFCSPHIGHO2_12_FULL_45_9]